MAKKKMRIASWIWIVGIIVILVLIGVGYYNNFVKLDQNVQGAWATVESDYQRRFDLIPGLVETVKGAADFEKNTYLAVTEARTKWLSAGSVNDKISAANEVNSALARLLVTVENYPDLKATQNFSDFQAQLEGTENRITVARNRFNEAAKIFNTATKRFPAVLFASMFGFDQKNFFEADSGAENAPDINFNQ